MIANFGAHSGAKTRPIGALGRMMTKKKEPRGLLLGVLSVYQQVDAEAWQVSERKLVRVQISSPIRWLACVISHVDYVAVDR